MSDELGQLVSSVTQMTVCMTRVETQLSAMAKVTEELTRTQLELIKSANSHNTRITWALISIIAAFLGVKLAGL